MEKFVEQQFEKCGPHIVSEEIDGEIVSINLDSGNYYSMRGTAARIWLLLQACYRIADVMEDLRGSYGNVGPGTEEQVTGFVESLVAEGLLRIRADDTGTAAELSRIPPPDVVEEFVAPGLETYTDMQDFLLVDPIHELDVTHWPPKQDGSSVG